MRRLTQSPIRQGCATEQNCQAPAERPRQIYKAIRARKPDLARALMSDRLQSSGVRPAQEER